MNQQELQQRLQQLAPKYQKKFQEEQRDFFDTEPYKGPMHNMMLKFRQFTFMHVSEASLNISYEYWKQCFHGNNDVYNLNDITVFISACQRRTLREWLFTFPYTAEQIKGDVAIKEWDEYRRFVIDVENFINPLIDKFTSDLLDKLLRMQSLDVSGQSKSIPFHKRQ